jgi:hypothetical protein
MKDAITQYFTGIEAEKRKELLTLMNEWRDSLADKEFFAWFNTDGFFPNYYRQKHKVLFVGREARYITADGDNDFYSDYIAKTLGWLKKDIQKDNSFWGRIFKMVQLFKSDGKKEFEQLTKAKDYAKEMAENNDYGFALMNISKYSNDLDSGGTADYDIINQFLEDSQLEKHNYFHKELEILDPDYIITFNLWENGEIDHKYLDLCLNKGEEVGKYPKDSPDGRLYNIDINGKMVKLLDIYHPSSRKPTKECFYMPIKELLFSDGNIKD